MTLLGFLIFHRTLSHLIFILFHQSRWRNTDSAAVCNIIRVTFPVCMPLTRCLIHQTHSLSYSSWMNPALSGLHADASLPSGPFAGHVHPPSGCARAPLGDFQITEKMASRWPSLWDSLGKIHGCLITSKQMNQEKAQTLWVSWDFTSAKLPSYLTCSYPIAWSPVSKLLSFTEAWNPLPILEDGVYKQTVCFFDLKINK